MESKVVGTNLLESLSEDEFNTYKEDVELFNNAMEQCNVERETIRKLYKEHTDLFTLVIDETPCTLKEFLINDMDIETFDVEEEIMTNGQVYNLLCNIMVRNPTLLTLWKDC